MRHSNNNLRHAQTNLATGNECGQSMNEHRFYTSCCCGLQMAQLRLEIDGKLIAVLCLDYDHVGKSKAATLEHACNK